jgi:predicted dinucleotide-binding enzyme
MSRRPFRTRVLTTTLTALLAAGTGLPAQPRTKQPLKIGFIGSGHQGGALGMQLARAGHEVMFSSRHPETLKGLVAKAGAKTRAGLPAAAATWGEVVIIAVPYGAMPQIGKDYAPAMRGKVVIDVGNPYADRDGPMANVALRKGTGLASAEYLPGVRLVRAFNAIGSEAIERHAHRAGAKLAIPIAGDDRTAVATVVQLVQDAGFDPVVVGSLSRAREFDAGTAVYGELLTAPELRRALKLPTQ